jgi:hypothetical protein
MSALLDKMQLSPVSQQLRAVALYRSTKTYDHNEGLSCCFRQWRADDCTASRSTATRSPSASCSPRARSTSAAGA